MRQSFVKSLSFILALIMVMCVFASCKSDVKEETDTNKTESEQTNTESDTDTETEAETEAPKVKEKINLIKDGEFAYTLVRPELTSSDLMDSIKRMRSKIGAVMNGKEPMIKEDWLNPNTNEQPGEFEIIIGETNREESKEVLKNLKYDDFAIEIVGKKLVIVGHTQEKTMYAVEYFIKNYIPSEVTGEWVITPEQCYIDKSDYKIDELKLNGVSVSEFSIVLPSITSAKNREYADKLKEFLSKNTGYDIKVAQDSKEESKYEILVDMTNRKESQEVVQTIRRNDHTIKFLDDKVVIMGGCPEETQKAIDKFISLVEGINRKEKVIELTNKNDLTYNYDKYVAENIKVNGTNIGDFDIVYAENDDVGKTMAYSLKNYLTNALGIVLNVHSDAKETKSDKEILIGETTRTAKGGVAEELKKGSSNVGDQGFLNANDNYVLIIGGNEGGYAKAYREFMNMIMPKEPIKGVYEIALKAAKKVQAELEQVKVMSYNIWTDHWEKGTIYDGVSVRRRDQVVSIIKDYSPDVIGLQEARPESIKYLLKKLPDYAHVGKPRDNASYESAPILYNKTKYNLIESGTQWLTDTPDKMSKIEGSEYYRTYTYVILENKLTGTRFVHVNTHLDCNLNANEKQMKILLNLTERFSALPIFYTADWNMWKELKQYNMITGAGFGDASTMTNNSMHGGTMVGSGSMIDFCFTSISSTIVTKHEIVKNHKYSQTSSDHYPIYVELSIIK